MVAGFDFVSVFIVSSIFARSGSSPHRQERSPIRLSISDSVGRGKTPCQHFLCIIRKEVADRINIGKIKRCGKIGQSGKLLFQSKISGCIFWMKNLSFAENLACK